MAIPTSMTTSSKNSVRGALRYDRRMRLLLGQRRRGSAPFVRSPKSERLLVDFVVEVDAADDRAPVRERVARRAVEGGARRGHRLGGHPKGAAVDERCRIVAEARGALLCPRLGRISGG